MQRSTKTAGQDDLALEALARWKAAKEGSVERQQAMGDLLMIAKQYAISATWLHHIQGELDETPEEKFHSAVPMLMKRIPKWDHERASFGRYITITMTAAVSLTRRVGPLGMTSLQWRIGLSDMQASKGIDRYRNETTSLSKARLLDAAMAVHCAVPIVWDDGETSYAGATMLDNYSGLASLEEADRQASIDNLFEAIYRMLTPLEAIVLHCYSNGIRGKDAAKVLGVDIRKVDNSFCRIIKKATEGISVKVLEECGICPSKPRKGKMTRHEALSGKVRRRVIYVRRCEREALTAQSK